MASPHRLLFAAILLASMPISAKSTRSTNTEPEAAPQSPVRVALKPCEPQPANVGETALCGSHEVYEDRAARSGRRISLSIVVLPASESPHRPDPVFLLQGGPGGSATEIIGFAKNTFLSVFHKDHDLVFVDQRGTGKSNGLQCDIGDDPRDLQVFFGKLFPLDRIRACKEALQKTADLRMYSTPIAMDDLDEVREALGYGKIDIVAGSYGSIAAQVYMRQHPSSVRAVFLVGVATPGIKQPLLFGRAAQHALDLLFVDCAADQVCKGAFPNLKTEFDSVLARFDRGPLEVSMLNTVTMKPETLHLERENYVERIRFMLYTTIFARFVPLIVHKAYQGDFIPFETVSVRYNPGGTLARGMYMTVTCSEGVPFISPQEAISEAQGTFLGESRVTAHVEACREWPRGSVPATFIAPVKSNLPVLMFSGDADGSTPPWYGKDAVRYLPNGKQLLARYYGHQLDSPCMWKIMREFIDKASVIGIDASCAEQIRRPPFATEIPAAMAIR